MVQVDAFHGGELLNVQHILTVHGPGLAETEACSHGAQPWGFDGKQRGIFPLPELPNLSCPLRSTNGTSAGMKRQLP
jgi:hypothetical protein